MAAGVTPSQYSLPLETESVVRTTLCPLPAFTYTHSCKGMQTHSGTQTPEHTYLPLPTHAYTLMLHSPQHALTYMYMYFLSFLSLWTDLTYANLRPNVDLIRYSWDIEHLKHISGTLDVRTMHIYPSLVKV